MTALALASALVARGGVLPVSLTIVGYDEYASYRALAQGTTTICKVDERSLVVRGRPAPRMTIRKH